MSFGLQGAMATFQRMMDIFLEGLYFATAYLDDIIIHSPTWDNHISTIIERLANAGLPLCRLGTTLTTYGRTSRNGSLPQL